MERPVSDPRTSTALAEFFQTPELPPDAVGACCELTSRIHALDEDEPTRWLDHAADLVAQLADPGAMVWVGVIGPGPWSAEQPSDPAAPLTLLGVRAIHDVVALELFRGFLRRMTRREFEIRYGPDALANPRGGGAAPGRTSPRASASLHAAHADRVWAWAALQSVDDPPRIIVECIAPGREDSPERQPATLAQLRCVVRGLAGAFSLRFVRPAMRREQLLAAIGPAARAVVPMLVDGSSEAEIAAKLGRSVHTVHDYVKQVYRATGVRSRLELRDLWMGRPRPVAAPAASDTTQPG